RCEQLLDEYAGDRATEANVHLWFGGLEAMRGRFQHARAHIEDARGIYADLGLTTAFEQTAQMRGQIETLAGQPDDAERFLRESCEAHIRRHESSYLSSRASELADVLYRLGRYDEAESWARTAHEHAGVGDVHAQVFWRSIEARLAARRGETRLAESLASEAVAM